MRGRRRTLARRDNARAAALAPDQRVEGETKLRTASRSTGGVASREFAHAGHRELQRARIGVADRRQHMHLGAQLLKPLMADAEMLLLVDDDEGRDP